MNAINEARPRGGVVDVWPKLKGDSLGGTTDQRSSDQGKRIDYVIVGNPPRSIWELHPVSIHVDRFQDKKVTALSDHNAVAAEFHWRKR